MPPLLIGTTREGGKHVQVTHPNVASMAFVHVQEREIVLTKKVFSLEVCSTSVACIISI
jgi:hypothetical protein